MKDYHISWHSSFYTIGLNYKKADAEVRGKFSFGTNQHPVQDVYIREVVQTENGYTNKTVKKVFTDHVDAYASECKM